MDVIQEQAGYFAVDPGSKERIDDEVHRIQSFGPRVNDQPHSLRDRRVGECGASFPGQRASDDANVVSGIMKMTSHGPTVATVIARAAEHGDAPTVIEHLHRDLGSASRRVFHQNKSRNPVPRGRLGIELASSSAIKHSNAVLGDTRHGADGSGGVPGRGRYHLRPMVIASLLLLFLASLVIVWWVVVIARLARMLSTGLSLRRGLQEPVEDHLVSIVVPAHNEERVIGDCLDSLLAQRWGRLQIIVVADRCTDGTESIVADRVNKDDRVTLIRNTDCPESWAGKCHAARIGAEHAEGDWVVFVDADTQADPDLLRAAMGEAQRRDTALLSLLTDLVSTHWFERSTQPVASMALMSLYPPDRVNRDDRGKTFANGQFMLFNRDWYEQVGGHAAVKDDLLEDIAFARAVCDAGGRVNILQADGLLLCSMYGSHEDFLRGWMRIFLEASGRSCRILRKQACRQVLLGWCAPGVCVAAVVLGVLAGGPAGIAAIAAGGLGLLMQLSALGWVYSIARQPLWTVLLFPIGAWEVSRVMRWAERTLRSGEPVRWGGREYVIKPNDRP